MRIPPPAHELLGRCFAARHFLVLGVGAAGSSQLVDPNEDRRWLAGVTSASVLWLLASLRSDMDTNKLASNATAQSLPLCKVCDTGRLQPKQVHRLGGVVAAIGYLLLLPAVVFMGVSIGTVLLSYSSAVSETDPSQMESARGAAAVMTVLGGGAVITALVGSLLGWLLVMKKRILQCDACGATVAAS